MPTPEAEPIAEEAPERMLASGQTRSTISVLGITTETAQMGGVLIAALHSSD